MRRFLPLSLSLLTLSLLPRAADASIYIGNPKLTVRIAAGTGLTFQTLTLDHAVVRADACTPPSLNSGNPIELLGIGKLLPHSACAVGIETGDLLTITGVGSTGGTFELELAVGDLVRTLAASETIWPDSTKSKAFILELAAPGWVTESTLGLSNGVHTVVDAQHLLHDDLVDAIELDSALFRDDNGDGVLQSGERSAGRLD